MKTLRPAGALTALALTAAALTTSGCYETSMMWYDQFPYPGNAVHKGPNSPYLVGIDDGRSAAIHGSSHNTRPQHTPYHDYASRTWYQNGYYEGYHTADNVIPPNDPQTKRDAFALGNEKGRHDQRLGHSPYPARYFSHVAPKNRDAFEEAYHRGYKLEAGPYPAF
ncbi:MAG: hypothetical protein AAGD22_03670 [Verrucomicrobiota bacterium]